MQRLPLAWTRSGETEWEIEVERASSSSLEFRSSSAPVDSRAPQVANDGNGDGKDCLRAVKTRQSRPGFPRLAIGAANHKSSCFSTATIPLSQSLPPFALSPFSLNRSTPDRHTLLYTPPTDRAPPPPSNGPLQERFAQHTHSCNLDLHSS